MNKSCLRKHKSDKIIIFAEVKGFNMTKFELFQFLIIHYFFFFSVISVAAPQTILMAYCGLNFDATDLPHS